MTTSSVQPGLVDILSTLRAWRSWYLLGLYDFRFKYRRTIFGPLWQIAKTALWIAGLWVIFGRDESHILYIAAGVITWYMVNTSFVRGPLIFATNRTMILNYTTPLTHYILQAEVSELCRWGLQFTIFLVIIPAAGSPFGLVTLYALPGIVAIIYTSFWVMLLLAILGARSHDLGHATEAAMRFLFFATPVFWIPGQRGELTAYIAQYNPLTYFLHIVREPILGNVPSLEAWGVVLAVAVTVTVLTVWLFNNARNKVPFWL